MKTTIRKGMFETNSSSMHSIIISKEKYEPVEVDNRSWNNKPIKYHIGFGYKDLKQNDINFCRGEANIYSSPFTKAQILILLYAHKFAEDNNYKTVMTDICKKISDLMKSELNLDVTISIPPREKTHYEKKDHWYINVDSEGIEDLEEIIDYVEESNDNLKRYLFDSKTFLILAGDEYTSSFRLWNVINKMNYDYEVIGNEYNYHISGWQYEKY